MREEKEGKSHRQGRNRMRESTDPSGAETGDGMQEVENKMAEKTKEIEGVVIVPYTPGSGLRDELQSHVKSWQQL